MIAGRSRARPAPTTKLTSDGRDARRLAAQQLLDDPLAAHRRDGFVDEDVAQLVAALERAGEAEQLVLDLVE